MTAARHLRRCTPDSGVRACERRDAVRLGRHTAIRLVRLPRAQHVVDAVWEAERCDRENACPANGLTVHPQDASTRERTGGAPLAATTAAGTRWSVCKRRDAVRLALHEPARPAGAAFGVLSGATVSWAAPRHACTLCIPVHWA